MAFTQAGLDALKDQLASHRETRQAGDKRVTHSVDALIKQIAFYERELSKQDPADVGRVRQSLAAVRRDDGWCR